MLQVRTSVEERVFGEGHFLRPNFVQTHRCSNVLIEGVTILQSPMWVIHPILSTNVTVRGITMRSLSTNNDGCNPKNCCDVLIEDCVFETGDNCIAIKSGRDRVPAPPFLIAVNNRGTRIHLQDPGHDLGRGSGNIGKRRDAETGGRRPSSHPVARAAMAIAATEDGSGTTVTLTVAAGDGVL